MNTKIQPFEFENNQVRAMADGDEVMFVASDIAKILGYRDAAALTRTLDDEEKGTRPIGTLGGTQQLSVISEPGLYKAILQRQTGRMEAEVTKAFVKRFQRWVTHEVLPTIRKTGGYIPTAGAESDEDILAKAVLIAQKTIDLKNQQLRAKDEQIKALEPKAQALDDFTNVEDKLLIREAAKVLSNSGTPISEKQLREWMTDNGWVYKANCSWHATARHCTAGHLVMVMSQDHVTKADGTKFAYPPTVRITRKGLALIHKRLSEDLLANALETTTTD